MMPALQVLNTAATFGAGAASSSDTAVAEDPYSQSLSDFTTRSWDWASYADNNGYVNVIVSERSSGKDSTDAIAAFKAYQTDSFSIVFQGFAAHVSVNMLNEYASGSSPSIDVYPDLPVNATVEDNILQIGADQVWSMTDSHGSNVRGTGIIVAVIDTGIAYTHPDLGGGFGPSYKVIGGYDFHNKDSDPMDDNGHGTHVAGIIAASGVLTGVAPGAKLLAYKALGSDGSGSMSNVILGVERAMDPNDDGNTADHANVISMSLGGSGDVNDPICKAVQSAIDAGVVVVVAAGNSGPSMGTVASPGVAPNAITVGAINETGALASFSSRGVPNSLTIKPEISAPGVNILSTVPYSGTKHSSSSGYSSMSGTSMATPHVSGAVALLLQLHPLWTPAQVKSALISGSSELAEPLWLAGAGGLWVPGATSQRLFAEQPLISCGFAGEASQQFTVSNSGSSISLTASSTDRYSMSADGSVDTSYLSDSSTPSPPSLSIASGSSGQVSLSVAIPPGSAPEGYYEGSVLITGPGASLRIPFGFALLSRLTVRVINMAGDEVFDPYGGVWVYNTPNANIAIGARGGTTCAPPATFMLPSGQYSVHAMGHQLIYTYSDPYILSDTINLGRLVRTELNLTMASANRMVMDLATEDGNPIYVKDYRVYTRFVGAENNVSFHLIGSDYSVIGNELFGLRTSMPVYVSNTDATVGISIAGFSYSSGMWDFMARNWDHWYESTTDASTSFFIESSSDLQYLLAWEFSGITSSTPTALAVDPSKVSVYDTKYDIPGALQSVWGNWGTHLAIGGDSSFYMRRDTDTSLNPFFSGMTRRTLVQGVWSEPYFYGGLFDGYFVRQFYSSDYSHTNKADTMSDLYLPDRNFLQPNNSQDVSERLGEGPFYPSVRTENTNSAFVLFHPLLRDQSDAVVGGMYVPTMRLYKDGGLSGIYQLSEYLSRLPAERIVALTGNGVYTAEIDYQPTPQICNHVTIALHFTVPSTDVDPPEITGLAMSQRFAPGSSLPVSVSAHDDESTVSLEMSWRLSGTADWQVLPVTPVGPDGFDASIQIPASAESIDLKLKATDASGNYIEYTALSVSNKQIPVSFDLSSDKTEIGYRNGDAVVVLSGHLTDASGDPIHSTAAVPLELKVNNKKVAMILDENCVSGSHTHDGTIRFEWHFNPALIFGGPNETVNIDVAFDLGTYEPLHRTLTFHSVYYYNPAPLITLLSPADGSLIPAGQLIDVDVFDDSIVQVQMRLDGQAAAQLPSPWDIDTARWTEGDHLLEITATDDQMVSSTARFTFHVDRSNPVVEIMNPKSGSAVPQGWTITAEVSDDHLDQVTYALDNGTPQALASPYTINMTGWLVGNHSVVIVATDLVGHSASDSIYFEIREGTLVLNLVSPINGDVVHSGVQIEFSVLSFDTFTSRWAEYGARHSLGASTSISTSGWIEGLHVITINSTDAFGGWDEMEISITIDDTNPIITLNSPSPQTFVSPSDMLSVGISDDNFKSVTWSLWGQNLTNSSSDILIPLTNSPGDGYFTVYLSALDKAGNEENRSFSFAMDSCAPTLEVQGLQDGDALRSGQVLTVVPKDVFLSNVWWSVDSGVESILQAPYTIDTSAFSAGLHSLKLVAADYSGKSCALNMSLYIDTAPPIIVTAFPTSVSADSSFDLSANITDDFKVGRADLYYELKDGGFGSVQMYDTGSTFNVQIASTISTWNGMIVYIRACDSVGNWAESEHVKLVVTSTSSNDGVPPASGDNPNSGLGQFSFVSWLSTVEGMVIAGILIGMLALAAAIYRRHRRSSEDVGVLDSYARPRPREVLEVSVRRSSPKVQITSSTVAASARPAFVDSKPILAAVAKKTSEVARHAEVRAVPSLLDAIPARPIKAVASDVETQDDEDYGALIEQELIIPSLKHSVFSDEVRDLTRELARYVDFEFQTKKHPESARNSPVH
jgi:subtilisin family serine protease